MKKYTLLFIPALFTGQVMAQDKKPDPANDPKTTEVWEPIPKIVTPGKLPQDAPSDAIILFSGRNLDAWHSVSDPSKPAA